MENREGSRIRMENNFQLSQTINKQNSNYLYREVLKKPMYLIVYYQIFAILYDIEAVFK